MLANVTQKRTAAPPLPPPRVEYYLSEARVFSADGKPVGILTGLVRREFRPADRKIVETQIALDPAPDALPTVVTLEWVVDDQGDTASIGEQNERVRGKGRLAGPAWGWTSWSSNIVMKEVPGIFKNTAKVTPRGVSIHTEQVDAEGKRLSVFDEVDTKIRKETYDLLKGRLLP